MSLGLGDAGTKLTGLFDFDMKLTSSEPVLIQLYPIPYTKQEALRAKIKYLLTESISSHSVSPHSEYCFTEDDLWGTQIMQWQNY